MSDVKFACPKCNQSLEGDETMRGQVVECPSCNTKITVPSGQQKKQIILPQSSSPAIPTQTPAPPPKARTGKVGVVVALVIGLVIGYGVGYGVGSGRGISSVNTSDTQSVAPTATQVVGSKGDKKGPFGLSSSPYTVVYGPAELVTGRTYMTLTLKGPAAKLAVILREPDGSEECHILSKEDMITNSRKISFFLSEEGRVSGGDYVLRVKTIDTEDVVFQETIHNPGTGDHRDDPRR